MLEASWKLEDATTQVGTYAELCFLYIIGPDFSLIVLGTS